MTRVPDPADRPTTTRVLGRAARRRAAHPTLRGVRRRSGIRPGRCARSCGATEREWLAVARDAARCGRSPIVHPPTLPAFADRTPYGAVVVRLDEGVFLVSNVVDCPVDELAVGVRVELALTRVAAGPAAGDDLVLPLFRRVER